ncbi:glycosyltransferase family 2 protein, partial [Eubacterium aggregans]|uniref:glycosyltransferase family 2 protein n=1 Tax=Eubacterium aggregans TaxID=81409 RepID=UPI003F301A91
MEKTLTISIAAYNVSLFLEKNIESIIASNRLSQIDVIIVNDGSKDDTAEIAKKYMQQFPESISVIDKKNGGYGSTINHSLSKARGKYYRLLDGDDWVDSEALTSFIDSIMKFDFDLLLNPYKTVIEGLEKENIVHILAEVVHKRIYDLTEISSRIDLLPMHGMTFRTELLKENEIFITENCFYTDAEFTIFPLPFVSTVAYLNDVVYCYRIGLSEQSMSFNGFKKHYKEHQMV